MGFDLLKILPDQSKNFLGLLQSLEFVPGLVVEQVSFLFAKKIFFWNDELQESCLAAKAEIVRKIGLGVTSFKEVAVTSLISDWSKDGIGFILVQKPCSCVKICVSCCKS